VAYDRSRSAWKLAKRNRICDRSNVGRRVGDFDFAVNARDLISVNGLSPLRYLQDVSKRFACSCPPPEVARG